MSLTKKRVAFVEAYVKTGVASQSVIEAGFSPKTAGSYGSHLLTIPSIQEAIAELSKERSEVSEGRIADADEVLEYLTNTMRGIGNVTKDVDTGLELIEPAETAERLRAAEMLGKRHGIFIDRSESRIATELTVSIDYGDES